MVIGEREWLFIALVKPSSRDIDRGVNLGEGLLRLLPMAHYRIIFNGLQLSQIGTWLNLYLFLMALLLLHCL